MIKEKNVNLTKEIEAAQEEFRQALTIGDNDNMVRAYERLRKLKDSRDAKKSAAAKLEEEFNEYKEQQKKEMALQDVKEYYETTFQEYKQEAKEILDNVEKARQDYIESLKPLNKLNSDCYKESLKYFALMMKYDIDFKEVGLPNHFVFLNQIAPHPRKLEITDGYINKHIRAMD